MGRGLYVLADGREAVPAKGDRTPGRGGTEGTQGVLREGRAYPGIPGKTAAGKLEQHEADGPQDIPKREHESTGRGRPGAAHECLCGGNMGGMLRGRPKVYAAQGQHRDQQHPDGDPRLGERKDTTEIWGLRIAERVPQTDYNHLKSE